LVRVIAANVRFPEPKPGLFEGVGERDPYVAHSPAELHAGIAPGAFPDAGISAEHTRRKGDGEALPQPGAVELAEVGEAEGELEGHTRGDGSHVDDLLSRIGSGVPGGKDTQFGGAVEERESVRVVDGEAAAVEVAMPAVRIELEGLVGNLDDGPKAFVFADKGQLVSGLFG
jgi:hypothetical protein